MKDIPGIDEEGKPKHGPFKTYFKNGLVSCEGEFDRGKKSGKWKYFLNNGQMQSSGSFKDGNMKRLNQKLNPGRNERVATS